VERCLQAIRKPLPPPSPEGKGAKMDVFDISVFLMRKDKTGMRGKLQHLCK
jgi:hypothetical protein